MFCCLAVDGRQWKQLAGGVFLLAKNNYLDYTRAPQAFSSPVWVQELLKIASAAMFVGFNLTNQLPFSPSLIHKIGLNRCHSTAPHGVPRAWNRQSQRGTRSRPGLLALQIKQKPSPTYKGLFELRSLFGPRLEREECSFSGQPAITAAQALVWAGGAVEEFFARGWTSGGALFYPEPVR